ncbi:MAG TPA: hypothetical protein VLL97_12595 [Acidobacteriota bacterium]|nr:hypothetical protein [Acidobacteriota bacterium]
MTDVNFSFRKENDAAGDAALDQFCRTVLETAFPEFGKARLDARFYPYIGLTHTIRRKGGAWRIRISDHCRRAPDPVLKAIILMLACKVLRKRLPGKYLYVYECFCKDACVAEAVKMRRRARGKKRISGHPGTCHSLPGLYREVKRSYFNDQVAIDRIGWGYRKSWRRLGHYDPVHHTVTLSPVLDSPAVPEFVVKFIVYHELLHAVFSKPAGAGRYHSREFRLAEKAHPDFKRAGAFLRDYCGKRRI